MAQSRASPIFLITLLLFTIANLRAQATFIFPNVQGLSATGQLCCTSNGNCPGAPIVGASVTLTCASLVSVSTVLGRNTTDINGVFNITVPAAPGVILSLSKVPCIVTVQLPLGAAVCPVLSTTSGALLGLLQSVGTLTTQVLGVVQAATLSVFLYSSIGIL